jgi:hypothetical protein
MPELDYDHVQGDCVEEERESAPLDAEYCLDCNQLFPTEALTHNRHYDITVCYDCDAKLERQVQLEAFAEASQHFATQGAFGADCTVKQAADLLGMRCDARQRFEVSDLKLLEAAGLVKKAPDYTRIRKLIDEGVYVPGVTSGNYEYVLRAPAAEPKEAA